MWTKPTCSTYWLLVLFYFLENILCKGKKIISFLEWIFNEKQYLSCKPIQRKRKKLHLKN